MADSLPVAPTGTFPFTGQASVPATQPMTIHDDLAELSGGAGR